MVHYYSLIPPLLLEIVVLLKQMKEMFWKLWESFYWSKLLRFEYFWGFFACGLWSSSDAPFILYPHKTLQALIFWSKLKLKTPRCSRVALIWCFACVCVCVVCVCLCVQIFNIKKPGRRLGQENCKICIFNGSASLILVKNWL